MNKTISSIFFLISLFISCHLLGDADQYETMIVERIDVILENAPVMTPHSTASIRARITTEEGQYFSQATFDCDLKALSQDFADVDPYIEVVDKRLVISLRIQLKPTIRSIQWCGNREFSVGRLQTELGVKVGSVYDRLCFNRAFQKLKIFYIKGGFFESTLTYVVECDEITNEVDIMVNVCEGRCGKIHDIYFHGLCPEEEADLNSMLLTQKWSFLTSWLYETGVYNEDMILQDKYIVLNYLHNLGYADAEVCIEPVECGRSNRIEVHVYVDKGQRYYIGDISFEGYELFCEEDLRNTLCIREGSFYSPEGIQRSVTALSDLYGCKGYIDAIIDYEPILDEECPVYSLKFHIDEGEIYRVGLIKIFGNCVTQNRVILHESLMIPGEIFNIQKLKASEARLANIGYFKCVNIYTVRSDNPCFRDSNYRDVHIEVEEASTGNFNAFFGLSSVETIFGGFTITEKNFNYRGLGRMWRDGYSALRGGGEYLYYSTNIGSKSRKYTLSWTKPYFWDTPWIVGFEGERSNVRYVSSAYEIDAWSFNAHAKYPINPFLRFGWHYRLRNTDMNVLYNGTDVQPISADARNDGITSATGVTLSYDSTDHPIFPSCGLRSGVALEYAGVGGDHYFFSVGYNNALYYSIFRDGIVKLRADVRFINPLFDTTYDNMPVDERLFLGGADNVRGYKDFVIGPKYPFTNEPRGGISLCLLSAEYTWRLSRSWEPFVFFDAGSISDEHWKIENIRTSTGFGARLCILGNGAPLTIGVGYPLNEKSEDEVRHFFFSMGGSF